MRYLRFIERAIVYGVGLLLVAVLIFMILLACLQIALRNLFASGIIWADSLLKLLVLWIGFLGAVLATYKKKHINIDILSKFLPTKIKILVRCILNIVAAVVCAFLLIASIKFITYEMEPPTETLFFDIPTWTFQLIIPGCFGIIVFNFLMRTVEDIGDLF
jgi:TRAP-type C4-dicarboxylate transport system permease small subunit